MGIGPFSTMEDTSLSPQALLIAIIACTPTCSETQVDTNTNWMWIDVPGHGGGTFKVFSCES